MELEELNLQYLAENQSIVVGLPSSNELIYFNKPGYIIFIGISIRGSLDGKNALITVREGLPPGIKTIYSNTIANLQAFNATAGVIDNIPVVTQFDDTNKIYTILWAPRRWLPYRALQIYSTMPAPTLDTATFATVFYSYAVRTQI
jgi:hypothetical protein